MSASVCRVCACACGSVGVNPLFLFCTRSALTTLFTDRRRRALHSLMSVCVVCVPVRVNRVES